MSDTLEKAEDQKRRALPNEKVPANNTVLESLTNSYDTPLTYGEWKTLSEALNIELLHTAEVMRVELCKPVTMIAGALPILAEQQSLLFGGLRAAETILNTPVAELNKKVQDKKIKETIVISDDEPNTSMEIKQEDPASPVTTMKLQGEYIVETEAYGCLSPARKRVLEKTVSDSADAIAVRVAERKLADDKERRSRGQQLAQHGREYAERVSNDPMEEIIQISKKELARRIQAGVAAGFQAMASMGNDV